MTGRAALRAVLAILAIAIVGLSALVVSTAANAAPAAGEDQYLEQVPNGGGTTDDKDPSNTQNFSESVGNDGTVTADDVKAEAKKNKKKQSAASDTSAKTTVADTVTTPPAATESVATAAKLGPFSRNTTLALLALIIATGAGAVVIRNRNAVPPTDVE